MGILDHRKTWHYEVAATPAQCMDAFATAFSGRGGLVSAKWDVRRSASAATAVYGGRKGLMGAASAMSRTASQEQDTAIGSEVQFQIDGTNGRTTRCTMALTSAGRSGVAGLLGVTSDARFIRPYMQAVARELRKLDPAAKIEAA